MVTEFPAVVVAVYRSRNAAVLLEALQGLPQRGWRCALWALDEEHPDLAAWTVGSGPGAKFSLVKHLLESLELDPIDSVVVLDDDVRVHDGGLPALLQRMADVHAGLGQPAHGRASHWSHRITRRRPWARARLTTFVEIGPVFAVGPEARDVLATLPDDMGWGLELAWWQLWRAGRLRLAIVDEVRMTHLSPPGSDYGLEDQRVRTQHELERAGLHDWREVQKTLVTWPVWRRRPPARAVA